jgi:hypothetical protein
MMMMMIIIIIIIIISREAQSPRGRKAHVSIFRVMTGPPGVVSAGRTSSTSSSTGAGPQVTPLSANPAGTEYVESSQTLACISESWRPSPSRTGTEYVEPSQTLACNSE